MILRYYRGPVRQDERFFFLGAPLIGGFVGGLLGSALVRPRPFVYPYPPPVYYPYPYGGPAPYGYGPYNY